MARPSLADLKARFKEKEQNQKNKNGGFSNDYYPFWNIPINQEAEIRIIADPDEENPEIYQIEKLMHFLDINGEKKRVPCVKMYGDDCPMCERSRKYYKASEPEKGKYYFRKRSVLVRGLILKDPIPLGADMVSRVGTVKILELLKEVETSIIGDLAGFADDADPPWDLENGVNFVIRKKEKVTTTGKQADYSQSGFNRQSDPIPAAMREAIPTTPLSSLLPKNPGLEKVCAMLEAHDNGAEYVENSVTEQTKPTTPVSAAPIKLESDSDANIPFDAVIPAPAIATVSATPSGVAPATNNDEDDNILARIKNRNKPKAST